MPVPSLFYCESLISALSLYISLSATQPCDLSSRHFWKSNSLHSSSDIFLYT